MLSPLLPSRYPGTDEPDADSSFSMNHYEQPVRTGSPDGNVAIFVCRVIRIKKSSNTVAASSKVIPCFARLAFAMAGDHSKTNPLT